MMNVTDKEGYHRSTVSSFTEYTHSRNFFQTLQSISCQFMLMGGYLLQTDTIHIIECFRQSGSSDIVRCTGFKLERKFIESRFFKRDMLNHLSSSLVRRKAVQPFFLSIKYADTCRTIYFMSGEHEKIGIQILYVHFHVRDRLSCINQTGYTVSMCCCNHFLHRIHRTQYVRHMHHTDNLRAFGE